MDIGLKKGELEQTELVLIIFASVCAIALITIMIGFMNDISKKSQEEVCTQSIILHTKVSQATANIKDTGLNCPAPHYVIHVANEDEAYINIANQLKTCWSKTLGKQNRLSLGATVLGVTTEWTQRDVILVCSSFEVDKDIDITKAAAFLSKKDPQTKRPWTDFLDTTWYSNDNSHFFVDSKFEAGNFDGTIKFEPLTDIKASTKDTKIKYLVVFMSYSNKGVFNSQDLESSYWDIQFEPIGDGYDWAMHTFVIPEDDVYNLMPDYFYWDKEGSEDG